MGAYHYSSDNNNSSDTESISSDGRAAFSGPLGSALHGSKRASRKSARFNIPLETAGIRSSSAASRAEDDDGEPYVEITLDIRDDGVAVHSVQAAGGANELEDPELALLARRTFETRKSSSFGSSVLRSTSSRFRQVSQELKRIASLSRRPTTPARRFDRTRSAAAHALKGFKFITAKTGGGTAGSGASGWPSVEKRFDQLTASSGGLLHCSQFGECIGKSKTLKNTPNIFVIAVQFTSF